MIATTDELRSLLTQPLGVIAKLITVESGEPYETAGTDWQWQDFRAIFATTAEGYPSHRLCYLERRRGESKTQDMAAVATADLVTGSRHQSYAIGGDLDMAGLLVDSIAGFCARMPMLAKVIEINRHTVKNRVTGSVLKVLAADVATSFGIRPKRVLADELSLWEGDRGEKLWTSMWSSTAKSPASQLVAGSMCGWDFASIGYRVRQLALDSKTFYFSSREGTEPAPWLSRDAIEEQRQTLHPADFARFWECRWVEPSGSWISVEMFNAAEKGRESYRGDDQFSYVAFIDVGLTHDPTVIAVAHAEGDRAVCDTLKTFQGEKGNPVELEAVEQEVLRLARRYHLRSVRFESPQAVASSQRLARRLSCNVEFRHPTADTQANLWGNLYRLFANGLITVYPHEQLRRESLSLVTKTVSGRLKTVSSSSIHQDHILALGGACEMLLEDLDWEPEQNMPIVAVVHRGLDGVRQVVDTVGSLFGKDSDDDEAPADPNEIVHHPGVYDRAGRPAASHPANRTCGVCTKERQDAAVRAGTSWPAVAATGMVLRSVGRLGTEIMSDEAAERAAMRGDPVLCGYCHTVASGPGTAPHRFDCPEASLLGPTDDAPCFNCRFPKPGGHEPDCIFGGNFVVNTGDPGAW